MHRLVLYRLLLSKSSSPMFLSKPALSQNLQRSTSWVFCTETELDYILRQRPNRPLFQNQVRIKVFSHPVLPGDMHSTRKYSIIKSALPKVTLHAHLYFFLFLEKIARKKEWNKFRDSKHARDYYSSRK